MTPRPHRKKPTARRARPAAAEATPHPPHPPPPAPPRYPKTARAQAYARDVAEGRIVAGRFVVAACRRHLADLERGAARGLEFKPHKSEAALIFFEDVLCLEEGRPFKLEPFQAFIVGALFGWYRADPDRPGEQLRRYRYCYAEIGKGNGKTPLAAGIGLYGLVLDDQHAPEIYSAAAAKEQAKICFDDAVRMVDASPSLRSLLQVLTGSISYPRRFGVFRPLSSEDRSQHGKRVHIGILDEIHAHHTAAMAQAITAGTKNCRNALIVVITNSGKSSGSSICWDYHQMAQKILEGTIEKDDWFCYVCTLDSCPTCHAAGYRQPRADCPHCDNFFDDERTWLKANPGLGAICRTGYVRERAALGRAMPSERNNVLQLNACQWTESDAGWLNMQAWNTLCKKEGLTLEAFRGRAGSVAMDAANKVDLTSMAVVFEREPGSGRLDPATLDRAAQAALVAAVGGDEAVTGQATLADVMPEISAAGYACFAAHFVPESLVRNARAANQELYRKWATAGQLIVTPGAMTDFSVIMRTLAAWRALFPIQRFSYDPREMSYFVQQIRAQPWCDFELVEMTQSPAYISQPMKVLEALTNSGLLHHGGDPVLAWALGNVIQKEAIGGGVRKAYFPTRENDQNKIDPAVALIMALDGKLRAPEPKGEPGVVFV